MKLTGHRWVKLASWLTVCWPGCGIVWSGSATSPNGRISRGRCRGDD